MAAAPNRGIQNVGGTYMDSALGGGVHFVGNACSMGSAAIAGGDEYQISCRCNVFEILKTYHENRLFKIIIHLTTDNERIKDRFYEKISRKRGCQKIHWSVARPFRVEQSRHGMTTPLRVTC
jgi:hypothetical protein